MFCVYNLESKEKHEACNEVKVSSMKIRRREGVRALKEHRTDKINMWHVSTDEVQSRLYLNSVNAI